MAYFHSDQHWRSRAFSFRLLRAVLPYGADRAMADLLPWSPSQLAERLTAKLYGDSDRLDGLYVGTPPRRLTDPDEIVDRIFDLLYSGLLYSGDPPTRGQMEAELLGEQGFRPQRSRGHR